MKNCRIAGMMTGMLLLCLSFALAEDYPADYLSSGYREYLSGKLQSGYFVNIFTNIDIRQQSRVNARNNAEIVVSNSYAAAPGTDQSVMSNDYLQKRNAEAIRQEILAFGQQREKGLSAISEFQYIPHSDGKVELFTNGLLTTVRNERIVNELGKLEAVRDTVDMKYNEKRLLVSYKQIAVDSLGNISTTIRSNIKYTSDSLFYATNSTKANKNLLSYTETTTRANGQTTDISWQGGHYDGKFLRAFSERINDSLQGVAWMKRSNIQYGYGDPSDATSYREEGIDFLAAQDETDQPSYILERSNIVYTDLRNQLVSYHEVRWERPASDTKFTTLPPLDAKGKPQSSIWTQVTTDLQRQYMPMPHQFGKDVELDPSRLAEERITRTTNNSDGSWRDDLIINTYTYDKKGRLIGALTRNEYTGLTGAAWEHTYRDPASGVTYHLSVTTLENGSAEYSYIDPQTLAKVVVAESNVVKTLKPGGPYKGYTDTFYEIIDSMPMVSSVHSFTESYATDQKTLINTEETTVTYTNGLVDRSVNGTINRNYRVLSTTETTTSVQSAIDPTAEHKSIRVMTTTYTYDEQGNLGTFLTDAQGNILKDAQGNPIKGITGTGYGSGWEYSPTQGWINPHTSTITEVAKVILGRLLRPDSTEVRDFYLIP